MLIAAHITSRQPGEQPDEQCRYPFNAAVAQHQHHDRKDEAAPRAGEAPHGRGLDQSTVPRETRKRAHHAGKPGQCEDGETGTASAFAKGGLPAGRATAAQRPAGVD